VPIWVLACLLPLDGDGAAWWAGRFVLLAALVWIPLALRLVDGAPDAGPACLVQLSQPWCALLLVASFLQAAGPLALLLALPWAAWTALLGVRGLLRLREHPRSAPDELCMSLGMVALPVGGVWLLAARAGLPLLGFVAPFTLLACMHFHYAGLLMPTVLGLTGRLLGPGARTGRAAPAGLGVPSGPSGRTPGAVERRDRGVGAGPDALGRDAWRLYRILAPAASVGPWLVAIGITLGGLAEAVCGTLFATVLACVGAVLLLRAPARVASRSARALLSLALLATWPAMTLAALYALSRIGRASIGLETMALLHGPLLAIVFVGGGLLALAQARPGVRPGALIGAQTGDEAGPRAGGSGQAGALERSA
jgi:hypothetical protein